VAGLFCNPAPGKVVRAGALSNQLQRIWTKGTKGDIPVVFTLTANNYGPAEIHLTRVHGLDWPPVPARAVQLYVESAA